MKAIEFFDEFSGEVRSLHPQFDVIKHRFERKKEVREIEQAEEE